jgi:hypothetical protein
MYNLTLSERQAHITATALEFYMRFCIGQFDVPDVVSFRQTAKDYRKKHGIEEEYHNIRELMDAARKECFPELSGPGHSYGVGWNDKPEQQHAQIAYEIYKEILYEFHKDNSHANVHSYKPCLHYSDQPVPEFKPLEAKSDERME